MNPEVFQEAIDRYFSERPNLDYLNLEISSKTEITIKGRRFYCYEPGYSHEYHTSNKQLNYICDLCITNSQNALTTFDRVNLLSKVCLKHFYILKISIDEVHKKLTELEKLIKGKNHATSGSDTEQIERKIRVLPTRTKVEALIQSVFDKPKEIESEAIKLSLKLEQKLNRVEELVLKLEKHLL